MSINISTAILVNNKKILLLRRSGIVKHFTEYWQFPEGKARKDEDAKTTLVRELGEEIGLENISYSDLQFIGDFDLMYAGIIARRSVFKCKKLPKNIKLSKAHNRYDWLEKKDILKIKTVPGVVEILEEI
jgi:8-oxo-dGTP pyrophosphatase MutT (NUDIX family)